MILRYTYHSEHHADRQHRWVHFLTFAGAVLLLIAGAYELFLFFTDWHSSDDAHGYWTLALALAYLIVGGALTYAGIRHVNHADHTTERYVRVDDENLMYHLGKEEGTIPLTQIANVNRPNIRDLRIELKDGSTRLLPLYLITNKEKQDELITTLQEAAVPSLRG